MMFPKPQSGLGWPSIVVFNANNYGGVHLGKKIFQGAHTRPQNAPKIPLKPPKMAILRPNLNNDVSSHNEGLLVSDPMVNGEVHFGPKNDFMGW